MDQVAAQGLDPEAFQGRPAALSRRPSPRATAKESCGWLRAKAETASVVWMFVSAAVDELGKRDESHACRGWDADCRMRQLSLGARHQTAGRKSFLSHVALRESGFRKRR